MSEKDKEEGDQGKDKCSPVDVDVKIAQQPFDKETVSQPMTKTLLTEGLRKQVRDPERYGRCFSVLAFLLPNIDFSKEFRGIIKLEDKVANLMIYEPEIKEKRKQIIAEYEKDHEPGVGLYIEDDVDEHKEEIKDISISLNQRFYKVVEENWDVLAPLFEEESLADIE